MKTSSYLKSHMCWLSRCQEPSIPRNSETTKIIFVALKKALLPCVDIFDYDITSKYINDVLCIRMNLKTRWNFSCRNKENFVQITYINIQKSLRSVYIKDYNLRLMQNISWSIREVINSFISRPILYEYF